VVEEHVPGGLPTERLDDLKLVVSELVDNAYLHGRGEIGMTIQSRLDRIRVEVVDDGEGAAVKIREHAPEGMGGFGLKLVDQLCAAWGAQEGTTHVWAELPTS
jgi:serine/threonine-protein kinase RsbW